MLEPPASGRAQVVGGSRGGAVQRWAQPNARLARRWRGVQIPRRVGTMTIDPRFLKAEELGIRLEVVAGLAIWEAHPSYRHQKAVDRIRSSITLPSTSPACTCVHVSDVYVQFPDGSLKRPDVAVFCREPTELDEAITLVPEAVIEVVSKGYEAKDLELGPQFYLAQGVKDVVVFDPATLLVLHARRSGTTRLVSPAPIVLECGCSCLV